MTKLYKITDSADQTRSMCQWGEGVTIKTSGEGEMCGTGFTHWYTDPRLAVLFNPIHGNFDLKTAHLWEGEGEIIKTDGLKVGCIEATTLKRINFPTILTEQKVKFAILCILEVYNEEKFVRWAHNWLDGTDRAAETAEAAVEWVAEAAEEWVAEVAARAVAKAAEVAARAARAAEATVWAAKAAIRALIRVADAAETAEAAEAAIRAAEAAAKAAEIAAWAAEAAVVAAWAAKTAIREVIRAAGAAGAAKNINFVRIIDTSLIA